MFKNSHKGKSPPPTPVLLKKKKIHLAPRNTQKGVWNCSSHKLGAHCLAQGLACWSHERRLLVWLVSEPQPWQVRPLSWAAVSLWLALCSRIQLLICQMMYHSVSPVLGVWEVLLVFFPGNSGFFNLSLQIFLGVFLILRSYVIFVPL